MISTEYVLFYVAYVDGYYVSSVLHIIAINWHVNIKPNFKIPLRLFTFSLITVERKLEFSLSII